MHMRAANFCVGSLILAGCMDAGGAGGGNNGTVPPPSGGPELRSIWDWQLSDTKMDLGVNVAVLDLDPDNVSETQVGDLVARGVFPIAYISVGTLEDYRDDVGDFPARVIGKTYEDWPDERFLKITDPEVLRLMEIRFQNAKDMGFMAIEPDNMDVYINDSGFSISKADTVDYVLALADVAHGMDMFIGQKNVPELTPDLVDVLDFMVAEACYADGWCDDTLLYIQAGKPVFDVEYSDTGVNWTAACSYAKSVGISMIYHNRDLEGPAIDTCM